MVNSWLRTALLRNCQKLICLPNYFDKNTEILNLVQLTKGMRVQNAKEGDVGHKVNPYYILCGHFDEKEMEGCGCNPSAVCLFVCLFVF